MLQFTLLNIYWFLYWISVKSIKITGLYILSLACGQCIIGLMVEYYPATVEIGVRFPDDANSFFSFPRAQIRAPNWKAQQRQNPTPGCVGELANFCFLLFFSPLTILKRFLNQYEKQLKKPSIGGWRGLAHTYQNSRICRLQKKSGCLYNVSPVPYMHHWSNGRILPCHGRDRGSIPRWCSFFFLFSLFDFTVGYVYSSTW